MATDSVSWHCCTLCLQVSLNLFETWSRFFFHDSNNSSLQSFINFSLPSTSREQARDKISKGSNNYCSHCIIYLFIYFLKSLQGSGEEQNQGASFAKNGNSGCSRNGVVYTWGPTPLRNTGSAGMADRMISTHLGDDELTWVPGAAWVD